MSTPENRRAVAWLMMVSAAAIHVLDETLTDFLPFYNRLVSDLNEQLGFSLMPIFSFDLWLGGLIGAIILAFLLTPLVKRGGRIMRIFAIVIGIIMTGNALGHMFGSLYAGRLLPGFRSSPLILATAVWLLVTIVRRKPVGRRI